MRERLRVRDVGRGIRILRERIGYANQFTNRHKDKRGRASTKIVPDSRVDKGSRDRKSDELRGIPIEMI